MAWLFRLDFDDGNGWQDITANVNTKSFRSTRYLFNELEPTVNNCSFNMRRDANINKLLTTEKDIALNIQKDSVDYFTGHIRKNFTLRVAQQVGPIKIDGVDPGFLLQKKIDSNVFWQDYKVCDSADTDNSIIHQLMILAGFSLSDVATTSITKVIDFFVIDRNDDRTYWDVLAKIAFEFGYVFYYDDSGLMNFFNFLIPDKTTSNVVNEGDMLNELTLTKSDEKYRGVEIKFYNHIFLEDATVFSDITGGSADYSCNILVEPGDYYPIDADTEDWFLHYKIKDREILTVINASMVTLVDPGIVVHEAFVNHYTKAKYSVRNTSGSNKYINKFDVVGDATVKGDLGIIKYLNIAGSEELRIVDTEWLTSKTDAGDLAVGMALYYKFSDFQYMFTSNDSYIDYNIGDIVKLSEVKLGLTDEVVLIIQTEDLWIKAQTGATADTYDWVQVRKYLARGIEEFSPDSYESTILSSPPSVIPSGQVAIPTNIMTYYDDQVGYDDVPTGGTTTPVAPTVIVEPVATRALNIRWDKQLNLTNLDHYEVQVSTDDTNWYELRNDGIDWKGSTDPATSDVNIESIVHGQLPNAGTLEVPSGFSLYYQVRATTKEPINSSWSTSVQGTTDIVEAGDIAANSIFANSLVAGILNALIANISEALSIGGAGFVGQNSPDGEPDVPVEGDQRARLDKNELTIEYYRDSAWETVAKLGGNENGGFFPWVQARGLAKPGAIDEIADLGLGDSIPPYAHLFSFDTINYGDDQNGHNPWSGGGASVWETVSVKYGDGALDLDTPPAGYLLNNEGFGIQFNKPFSVDGWAKEGYIHIESETEAIVQNEMSNDYSFGTTNNHLESDNLKADQAVTLDATTTVHPYKWDKFVSGTYYSYMYCDVVESDSLGQLSTVTNPFSNELDSISSSSEDDKIIQSGGICRLSDTRFMCTWEKRDGTDVYVRVVQGVWNGSSITWGAIIDTASMTIEAGIPAHGSAIDTIGPGSTKPMSVYIKSDGKVWGRKYNVNLNSPYQIITSYTESQISSSGSNTTPCSRPVLVGLSFTSAVVAYEYDGDIKIVAITLDAGNHLITSVGSETVPTGGVNTLDPCIDRIDDTHFVLGFIREVNFTVLWKAYSVSGNTLTPIDTMGVSDGALLFDKPSVAVIDTSGNMVVSYREYTTSPVNSKIHTVAANFDGTSFDFTGENITSINDDTEKYSLGAYIPRSYDTAADITQRILITTESYINAASTPIDNIHYQALPVTYSKLTLKGISGSSYFRLENWGISKTQTDKSTIGTWGGPTVYSHYSIFFDPAGSLDFTVNGNDISAIDASVLVLASAPCKFTIAWGWHDDLLVLPFGTITTTQSKAHYEAGLPWTDDVDFDTDLVLMPRSGGKIFLAENTEFIQNTLHSTISDKSWRIVGDPGEPIFTDSWINEGSPFFDAAFVLDPLGNVRFRGSVTGGASGTSVFTLPVGYRPTANIVILCPTQVGYGKVTINTIGTVAITATPSNEVSLDSIIFSVL